MSEGDKKQPVDASTLKSLFAQSSLGKDDSKDMKLSDKEKEGFTKAFEDPEFRKMFSEYMDEMQDPKHRAETDEYIRQLEKEEKVPEGKELIHPLPGFVAKTHKMDDKGAKLDKMWMNITSSDRVMEPRKQMVKGGESWSLPYSLGPPRMEKDSNDNNVATFDCCFHPKALDMGNSRKEFKDLLVRTAMEGVTESYKRQNSPVKLSADFHILKGVSYKTGITTAMMVDKKSKETWKGEKDAPETGGMEAVPSSRVEELPPAPAGEKEAKKQSSPPAKKDSANKKKEPSIKKGFLGGGGSTSKGDSKAAQSSSPSPSSMPPAPPTAAEGFKDAMKAVSTTKKEGVPSSAQLPDSLEPAYDVVERGIVDLGDFELTNSDGSNAEKARSTRPRELVVKIKLPKIAPKGIADVDLDISEKKLSLKYKGVYDLQLPLAYPVNDSAGSAKYEKNSQCLVVTLPVKANIVALPARKSAPEVQQVDREGKPVEEAGSEVPKAKKTSPKKAEAPKAKSSPAVADEMEKSKDVVSPTAGGEEGEIGENKSGLMSLDAKEKSASRTLQEEIAAGAAKALKEAKSQKKSTPTPKKASVPKKIAAESVDPNAAAFIASASFDGRKPGYVFKRDQEGVGYYLDTFGKKRTAKEDKPVVASTAKTASPEKQPKDSDSAPAEVPPFEYRQTPQAFSVIIKVPGVVSSSASVKFSSRSVEVVFDAYVGESHESKQSEGASCKTKPYAMDLYLPETLPLAFELDCDKSSFDVAEENVVLVMMKKSSGIWPETKDGAGALLQGKAVSAAVKGKGKDESAKVKTTEQPADRLAAKAREMKLNDTSATALYELD